MTLCVTRHFYNKKNPDPSKKQDNFRYVFIYKNPNTLRYAIFHGTFEIGGVWGVFIE